MTKRKILLVLLPVLTILMGFMPNGLRMCWRNSTGHLLYTYYPYISLLPSGYAYFTPILTLLLTGVLLAAVLLWLYLEEGWKAVRVLSVLALGRAVCAFVVNLIREGYFSAAGLMIAVLLALELVTVFTAKNG